MDAETLSIARRAASAAVEERDEGRTIKLRELLEERGLQWTDLVEDLARCLAAESATRDTTTQDAVRAASLALDVMQDAPPQCHRNPRTLDPDESG
jgi:hypothetical protein